MKALFDRMRLVGLSVLIVTFVAGALAGVAMDRVIAADDTVEARPAPRGERDRQRRYVIDQVEMAADQRAAIDTILERRAARIRTVWKEMESITDSTRAEIMSVLTPEQRTDYERRLEERRQRRKRR